jgi:hypothetical protein
VCARVQLWSTLFSDAFFFHPSLTGQPVEEAGGVGGNGSGGGLYVLRDGADAHLSATDDYEWLLAPPALSTAAAGDDSTSCKSNLLVLSPHADSSASAAAAVRQAVLALIEQAVRLPSPPSETPISTSTSTSSPTQPPALTSRCAS